MKELLRLQNQVEHEFEEKLELDRPIVTRDFGKEERLDKDIGGDHCSYLSEVDVSALEEKDCDGDGVFATEEE